uniref:Uncharacterized protein n=1 Tax=Glossina pallidipes TaxID=7398 RepID=A0A1A9ZCT8_GLOPL
MYIISGVQKFGILANMEPPSSACTNSRIAVTTKCMRLKYGFKSLPSWRAFNSSCSHSSARAQADSSQSVVPISLAPSELSTLSAVQKLVEAFQLEFNLLLSEESEVGSEVITGLELQLFCFGGDVLLSLSSELSDTSGICKTLLNSSKQLLIWSHFLVDNLQSDSNICFMYSTMHLVLLGSVKASLLFENTKYRLQLNLYLK